MESDRKWIIVRIDGKIAAVSTNYRQLADISARLAKDAKPRYNSVTASVADFEEVWNIRKNASWDDFLLFGTEFQKKVWKKLYNLVHPEDESSRSPYLISYSDFAELLDNRAGVRAVAHAIGLNPLAVIIPCHLVIPKESIDRINDIKQKAEATIFKGDDLCLDNILSDSAIDFGEYAQGRSMKRRLIRKEFRL